MSSINRPAHILKSEKSIAIPRYLLFFDTETKQVEVTNGQTEQVLKLGWLCYYSRKYGRHLEKVVWQDFRDTKTFWHFVFECCQDNQRLWCIARNLSFDFTVLKGWTALTKLGYTVKFFYNKGTCGIISLRSKKKSIVFLDSMNWFPESLEATGERIGLPKLKIDFATCTIKQLSTYCHRDVEIEFENFKLFIKFLEQNRIARLCYTRGSTAMSAYLLNHYNTKIYIHNNEQAIKLERDSYKGGRVECQYIGELNHESYYLLDVNSLYPFVMRNNLYPVKYEKISHKVSKKTLEKTLKTKAVVAQVLIETDEPAYAVRRERCLFPIGTFWTTLTTPEIKYAISKGHIVQVGDVVVYEQENIFRSYVDKFYKLRQEFKSAGNRAFEQLCKDMLNTLYGKFGQKGEDWEKIGDTIDEVDREETIFYTDGRPVSRFRFLMGEVFELSGVGESFDSFPAISAHVSAYGRMYLYNLMKCAGKGHHFYCDTDSLIVDKTGLKNLDDFLSPTKLGGLKIDETCHGVTLRGLKDYSTKAKNVTKGIRKNAIKISEGVYQQEKWPSFRGLLRSGKPENYIVELVTKHLSREYTKGIVKKNGVVVPFVLDELRVTV